MPLVVDRHRYRAQPGEEGAHLVGGVRHRGVEHGVARRVAQRQHPRQRRHHFLGADARDDVVDGDRAAEAAFDPPHRGLAKGGAADGGRIPVPAGAAAVSASSTTAAWGRRACRPRRRGCRRAPRQPWPGSAPGGRADTAAGRRPANLRASAQANCRLLPTKDFVHLDRARPWSLAVYIAKSARRSSSPAVASPSSVPAMPMLIVVTSGLSPTSTGSAITARTRSATCIASLGSCRSASTAANSSPPRRATLSEGRSVCSTAPRPPAAAGRRPRGRGCR